MREIIVATAAVLLFSACGAEEQKAESGVTHVKIALGGAEQGSFAEPDESVCYHFSAPLTELGISIDVKWGPEGIGFVSVYDEIVPTLSQDRDGGEVFPLLPVAGNFHKNYYYGTMTLRTEGAIGKASGTSPYKLCILNEGSLGATFYVQIHVPIVEQLLSGDPRHLVLEKGQYAWLFFTATDACSFFELPTLQSDMPMFFIVLDEESRQAITSCMVGTYNLDKEQGSYCFFTSTPGKSYSIAVTPTWPMKAVLRLNPRSEASSYSEKCE